MKYCPDIHHNVSIHYLNQTVDVAPCCLAKHTKLTSDNPVEHPRLIELRDINKKDILTSDCDACIKVEVAGGSSRRLAQQDNYKNYTGTGIRSVDLHLGNLCNMSCVICGPHDSTTWHKDAEQLGIPVLDKYKFDKNNQYDCSWIAELPDIEMIHFWGGEPFINPQHQTILEQLKKSGRLSHCRLIYNTNGSTRVSDEIIELWKQAHLVEIYFSIDDINERFEYQRYGLSWSALEENLQWFYNLPISNHLFYINLTWSLLNVFYIPEFLEWQQCNFKSNRFGDPVKVLYNKARDKCSLDWLNNKAFSALQDKFIDYPELDFILQMISIDNKSNDKFNNYVKTLDNLRNQEYTKHHSVWAELLEL